MLKALGATMAQVSQRFRAGGRAVDPAAHDRAEHTARKAERRRRMKTVLVLLLVFVVMVAVFSAIFHELMDREGRSFSWPTTGWHEPGTRTSESHSGDASRSE